MTHLRSRFATTGIVSFSLIARCLGQSSAGDSDLRHTRVEKLGVGRYRHEVERQGAGLVTWIDRSDEINDLRLYQGMLIAFGWSGGAAQTASIIDVKRSALVDYVLGREFALSPSGRYLAFKQFRPRHEMPPVPGDVLVVHEVPRGGRPMAEGASVAIAMNRGISIYPGEVGRSRANVRSDLDYEEVLVFSIRWESGDRLAALALDSGGLLVVRYDARRKARTMARVPGASKTDIDPSGTASIREMERLLVPAQLDLDPLGTAAVRFSLRGETREVRVRR